MINGFVIQDKMPKINQLLCHEYIIGLQIHVLFTFGLTNALCQRLNPKELWHIRHGKPGNGCVPETYPVEKNQRELFNKASDTKLTRMGHLPQVHPRLAVFCHH